MTAKMQAGDDEADARRDGAGQSDGFFWHKDAPFFPWDAAASAQCLFPFFARAHADDVRDGREEDLAISDMAGVELLLDGVDDLVHQLVRRLLKKPLRQVDSFCNFLYNGSTNLQEDRPLC